jgi:hypothetical protein
MSTFRRAGHYRTNWNGTTFWVNEHKVDRYSTGGSLPTWQRPTTFEAPRAQPVILSKRDSILNPASNCPVCGAKVYFYSNEYGSRVYFDEVGPPWPKHPCTDLSLAINSDEAYRNTFETSSWGVWYKENTVGTDRFLTAAFRKEAIKRFEKDTNQENLNAEHSTGEAIDDWDVYLVTKFSKKEHFYTVSYSTNEAGALRRKRFVFGSKNGPHRFDYFYMQGDRISYLDLVSLEIFEQVRAVQPKKPKINKRQSRKKRKRDARKALQRGA